MLCMSKYKIISFYKFVNLENAQSLRTELLDFCNQHLPGIRLNVNSLEELKRIPKNPSFTVGIRINPMIETGAPDIYHVSSDESKFGVPIIEKKQIIDAIIRFPVTQLHIHAGSHMSDLGGP